jgi:hypothetical protein
MWLPDVEHIFNSTKPRDLKMKKLIAGLSTALMMSVGLIAFSGVPSESADCDGSGCATTTAVKGPRGIMAGRRPNVIVGVKSPGHRNPSGKVEFVVAKVRGSFVRSVEYPYDGQVKALLGPTLNVPGAYTVSVRYFDPSGVYLGSSDSIRVRVNNSGPCPIQPPRYC